MDAELDEGAGGVFDVFVDGAEVYSKSKMKRHANPGEVLALIKARQPAT